jgi:hypothetical protein
MESDTSELHVRTIASPGWLRGLADKTRLDVETIERQLAALECAPLTRETARVCGWLRWSLREARMTLRERQEAAHAADPTFDITAPSHEELEAEYARGAEMMKRLRRLPERKRRYFLGRTLHQIRRDPLYYAVVRGDGPQRAATRQRRREHRPAANRRAASSSETSSADPGDPDPEHDHAGLIGGRQGRWSR